MNRSELARALLATPPGDHQQVIMRIKVEDGFYDSPSRYVTASLKKCYYDDVAGAIVMDGEATR